MILLCHNTLAKSYDSKVGLIIQKRCILVTVFAALLLPIMLYACYIFCCSPVTNIAVFLVTGYNSQGRAHIEFYNNSTARHLVISAEGLTPDGQPVVLKQ